MPNWVCNRVKFNCSKEMYEKIKAALIDETKPERDCVDFNRVIPEPEQYDTPNGWYDWRIIHWGCKWNASDAEILDSTQEIFFDTPWDRPQNVLLRLAEMFPSEDDGTDVEIEHWYADEFPSFVGYARYQFGEQVDEWEDEGDSAGVYEYCWGCPPYDEGNEEPNDSEEA